MATRSAAQRRPRPTSNALKSRTRFGEPDWTIFGQNPKERRCQNISVPAAASLEVIGFIHASNTSGREKKNFCFGQHAAIIFPRARIFRAITARDGEASQQRESTPPSRLSLVLNILRKTFSYKCPVGSPAFTGRIPSTLGFRNCNCSEGK